MLQNEEEEEEEAVWLGLTLIYSFVREISNTKAKTCEASHVLVRFIELHRQRSVGEAHYYKNVTVS